MNKPPLFLHVGTHKTGSTSIQQALRLYSVELRREKLVCLPLPKQVELQMSSDSLRHDLIRPCRDDLDRFASARFGEGMRFVMSSEGFSGESDRGYRNAPVVAEAAREITTDFDVSIIVYLRRQDRFIESLYTQSIQEGNSLSFDEFVARLPESSFNWEALVSSYSKFFGEDRVIVRRYGTKWLPSRLALLHDFGEVIGSRILSTLNEPLTANPGYSRDALEIARIANRHLGDQERRRLRFILQRTSPRQTFESFAFWSEEQRRELLARHEPSNANVAGRFLGETELFPLEPMEDQGVYPGVTSERAIAVLVRALLESDRSNEALLATLTAEARTKLGRVLRRFPRLRAALRSLRRTGRKITAVVSGKPFH